MLVHSCSLYRATASTAANGEGCTVDNATSSQVRPMSADIRWHCPQRQGKGLAKSGRKPRAADLHRFASPLVSESRR